MATIANDNVIVEFVARTEQFTRDRRKALQDADKDTTKFAGRFSRIVDTAAGFLGANLIQGAITGLGQLGQKALELSKNYEQTLVSFELFTGSLENAEALVEKLDKFSLETPFEPTEINNAAKTLLGFGRSADIVLEDLQLIGNAAAASGADLTNLSLVFGQVAGAGKLQGQDALQLINAGIPVYQLLSDSLGVSVAEVKELQGQGKITFETLREGFAKASQEGGVFAGALVKQSQTFGGLVSTAKGAFDALLRNAGDAFLPIIKELLPPLINGLFFLVDVVKQSAAPFAGLLVNAFKAFRSAIDPVIKSVVALFGQFSGGTPIMELFASYLTIVVRQFTVGAKIIQLFVNGIGALLKAFSGSSLGVNDFITNLSKIPAVIGGIIKVFAVLPKAVKDDLTRSGLFIQAFLSDISGLLSPSNLAGLLTGNLSIADILAPGKELRKTAEDYKVIGESIADAYREGFDEIANIKVELPPVATKTNLNTAKTKGEEIGKEIAKGVEDGLKKAFAASSIAGIKERISALQKIVEELADPTGDGIADLVSRLGEVVAKEGELETIENLIARIRGEEGAIPAPIAQLEEISEAEKRLRALADAALLRNRIDQINADADKERAAARVQELKDAGAQILSNAKDLADQLFAIEEARIDREIDLQQGRVNKFLAIAENGNAEQLQLEEQRLAKLQKEKEKAVRARQRLAAVEIAVNNAVAASESIKAITAAFAAGNIPLGIATAAALALTVASTVLTVANAFGDIPSFRVGTENFDPANPDATGGGLALLHRGERVLTKEQNAKLLSWGVGNEDIPGLVGIALGRIAAPSVVRSPEGGQSAAVERRLDRVEQAIRENTRAVKGSRPNVIFDKDGLRTANEQQAKRAARKARLRRG